MTSPRGATPVIDYSTVTETPGDRVRREAIDMLATRYGFAERFSAGRDVLEVACGAGQGLGFLARTARRVVGGDYTGSLLVAARRQYGSRAALLQLDAEALPVASRSFDVVLLFEAIYYLREPGRFLDECRRVLRPGGVVLINSVNCRWVDFNPSPFSVRYYDAAELRALLASHGFSADVYGAFAVQPAGLGDAAISLVKRTAVALNVVPRTMKGKALLKRVFYGRLEEFPPELQPGQGAVLAPEPIAENGASDRYKVLYAVGRPGAAAPHRGGLQ